MLHVTRSKDEGRLRARLEWDATRTPELDPQCLNACFSLVEQGGRISLRPHATTLAEYRQFTKEANEVRRMWSDFLTLRINSASQDAVDCVFFNIARSPQDKRARLREEAAVFQEHIDPIRAEREREAEEAFLRKLAAKRAREHEAAAWWLPSGVGA